MTPPLSIWSAGLALLLLLYVPGAILLRLPTAGRPARAALPADERGFWAVTLSLVVSSALGLLLAAAGLYSFPRLLVAVAAICLGAVAWSRRDLRLPRGAPRMNPWALAPAGLLVLGAWLFTPPGELVLGGKDPGVYVNEGIQIAQRGSLVIGDPIVAAVPAEVRDLFFPPRGQAGYHSLRFMGFFVRDPDGGRVVAQFPHLYPLWVSFGYSLFGVTGARSVVSACGILGLLAVYFLGAQLVGRLPALAAAGLLALNVAEVWFGRYSNAELGFQFLVFAALLAWVRATEGRGRLLAVLSATLVGLGLFLRIEALLVLAVFAALAGVHRLDGRVWPRGFTAVLGAWLAAGVLYYALVLPPYTAPAVGFVRNLRWWQIGLAAAGLLAGVLAGFAARRNADRAARLRAWIPPLLASAVVTAAAYAYFLRRPGGRLAPHDAHALRTFAAYYVLPLGLAGAVAGFVLAVRRLFWRVPAFFLTLAAFAFFLFYKIRIVPEHFWMARRFLPVILPGTLLMIAAAAFWPLVPGAGLRGARGRVVWTAAGAVLLGWLGWQFWQRSHPLLAHVEYAGAAAQVERLARRFDRRHLLVVESRQASDLHVLALPLAYVYGRQVLVLDSREPDKARFARFLGWARTVYPEVFFLGGGGTDLIGPEIAVQPIAGERFQLPEYASPLNAYPSSNRFKEFDFGIYRFVTPSPWPSPFVLDLGEMDDVYTVRFHAKERHARGTTFRWSRDESYITVLPPAKPQQITLWLSAGGRPAQAQPARVAVSLDDRLLGSTAVEDGFRPYLFPIPPDLSEALAGADRTARLTIRATTWNPRQVLGVPDDRDLGVMVDRLEVR